MEAKRLGIFSKNKEKAQQKQQKTAIKVFMNTNKASQLVPNLLAAVATRNPKAIAAIGL